MHIHLTLLGVVLYLMFAIAVSALLVLVPVRKWASRGTKQWWRRQRALGTRCARRWVNERARAGRAAQRTAVRITGFLRQHARYVLLAAGTVLALPLAAWWMRDSFPVDSFDDTASRDADARVLSLLQGEQLVPPAPLPPELFTTPDVEQWQPMARSASRQWELLDESFRQRLLLVFKLVRERHGYDMVLLEGYRSADRQAALAALGPSVTRAGPYESFHQYGLAADCAFIRDGKVVASERDPWAMRGYEAYGSVARSLGLTWGGDWRSLKDYGHVEWHRANLLRTSSATPGKPLP